MHFITCAAPSYFVEHGRPTHPKDLSRHVCLNDFSTITGRQLEWDFHKDAGSLTLDAPLSVNDSSVDYDACLAGLGIGQLTTSTARAAIQRGDLEIVLGEWLSEPLPIHIVYPLNRNLSNKVRMFAEWIAELFERDERLTLHSPLPIRDATIEPVD